MLMRREGSLAAGCALLLQLLLLARRQHLVLLLTVTSLPREAMQAWSCGQEMAVMRMWSIRRRDASHEHSEERWHSILTVMTDVE
jgi:hypothetical protein